MADFEDELELEEYSKKMGTIMGDLMSIPPTQRILVIVKAIALTSKIDVKEGHEDEFLSDFLSNIKDNIESLTVIESNCVQCGSPLKKIGFPSDVTDRVMAEGSEICGDCGSSALTTEVTDDEGHPIGTQIRWKQTSKSSSKGESDNEPPQGKNKRTLH